jgi:four helix bundle protein
MAKKGVRTQDGKERIQKTEFGRQKTDVRMKVQMIQRNSARAFKGLIIWQKAHLFVLAVYCLTSGFPKSGLYGLTQQFCRAALSIAANIAEGFRKRTKARKARFMNIAQGSLEECRYYLILATDLGYGKMEPLIIQIEEASKLLESYSRTILDSAE